MALKAAIVGGYGEMGRWFERFLVEREIDVALVGRSSKAHYADYDLVVIDVPVDVTCDVIAEVAPQMKPGAVLFDITSVKKDPVKPVSYTHLRAHETPEHLVCRLLLEKK